MTDETRETGAWFDRGGYVLQRQPDGSEVMITAADVNALERRAKLAEAVVAGTRRAIHMSKWSSATGRAETFLQCLLCNDPSWLEGEPERHKPDCPVALYRNAQAEGQGVRESADDGLEP